MTALALSLTGLHVTVLERAGADPRSGAALGGAEAVMPRVETLLGTDQTRAGTSQPTGLPRTWASVHARLHAAATNDPHIDLRHNTRVAIITQDQSSASATTAAGDTFRADLLFGADGHRSIVRPHVSPTRPDATFAQRHAISTRAAAVSDTHLDHCW